MTDHPTTSDKPADISGTDIATTTGNNAQTGTGATRDTDIPEPVISEKPRFSLVWLIPLVAVLIAGWLVYQSLSHTGPLVMVSFSDANGIEAGKTKVRFKDVVIGQVESVGLGPKLDKVLVGVRISPGFERLLTPGASWWVVRPRITSREISGLNTLLSGAHIEMVPGDGHGEQTRYEGLLSPPVVISGEPGTHFALQAETLGSLDTGSPVYYRRIEVGHVTSHRLHENGQQVDIEIFIHAPYDDLVHRNTHFWNASGISMDVSTEGLKIRTESLVSILSGGIAFELAKGEAPGPAPTKDHVFRLFPNHDASRDDSYQLSLRYIAYFDGSVRGLAPDAPVEFRGVQVGKVERISLDQDPDTGSLRIAVLLAIQPQRVNIDQDSPRDAATQIAQLVSKGMRAQLRSASLVSGSRFVALDMYPDEPYTPIIKGPDYPILPTTPEALEAITARISSLLDKFDKLPLEAIAEELRGTLAGTNKLSNSAELKSSLVHLDASMAQLKAFTVKVNRSVLPNANAVLREAKKTMKTAGPVIAPDSALHNRHIKALSGPQTTGRTRP
jgi:paraquat-inducible protein B